MQNMTTTEATITYAYMDDCTARSAKWTGDPSDAIAAAVDELNAFPLKDVGGAWGIIAAKRVYAYWAPESLEHYALTEAEMASFGAAVLDGRAEEAYSIWCASSGQQVDLPRNVPTFKPFYSRPGNERSPMARARSGQQVDLPRNVPPEG